MALCAGCPDPEAVAPAAIVPTVALPPPLVGGEPLTPSAADAVDPSLWALPAAADEPPHAPWLRLLYSQDARAEIEACGCPGAPSGGFSRRATMLAQATRWLPDVLVVEGPTSISKVIGGTESVSPRDRARAREILSLLGATGTTAFFPGQPDFAVLPPATLLETASASGLGVVVTNLDPAARPAGMLESITWQRDGARILFLGLLGNPRSDTEQLRSPSTEVVSAVRAVLEREAAADVVVAFTAAGVRERRGWLDAGLPVDLLLAPFGSPTDRSERWTDDVYEVRADPLGRAVRRVDIVLSGRQRGLHRQPDDSLHVRNLATREGAWLRQRRQLDELEAAVARGEDPRVRGRGFDGAVRVDPATDPEEVQASLARVRLERDESLGALMAGQTQHHLAAADLLPLDEVLAEDPSIRARIDAYHAKWIEAISQDLPTPEQAEQAGQYAGMDSCVACHAPIYAQWPQSKHARAYRDIYERGQHRNPDCLGCHTTGFGVPGGFSDPSDSSLLNVQCEACHGPMARHVREAQRPGLRPRGGAEITESTCRRCHDAANSPAFDYDGYLPRIAHPGVGGPGGSLE